MLSPAKVAVVFAYFGSTLTLMGVIALSAQALGVSIMRSMAEVTTASPPVVSRVAVGLNRARLMAKWRPHPKPLLVGRTDLETETSAFALARKMDLAQAMSLSEIEPIEVVAAAPEPVGLVAPTELTVARVPSNVARAPASSVRGPAVAGWVKRALPSARSLDENSVARIIERSLRAEI